MAKIEKQVLDAVISLKDNVSNLVDGNGRSIFSDIEKVTKPIVFTIACKEQFYFTTLTLLSNSYGRSSAHVKDFTKKVEDHNKTSTSP